MLVGTSFSPRRCDWFGMPAQETFCRVLDLGFGLVRLSAYWDEINEHGYARLDRLLDAAQVAGQSILLTVGMKAMQWPELYVPAKVAPDPDRSGRVGRDERFASQVLTFVEETVARYRDRRDIAAWQVENEPFNRSGPQGWWIDPGLLRREVQAVRALDSRPIVINAFSHFDPLVDSRSRPRRGPYGIRRLVPERAILDAIGSGDILGLDVYTAIGTLVDAKPVVRLAAPDWADTAARWLSEAQRRGKQAWIIESQAEPWEPSRETYADPKSFSPEDAVAVYDRLAGAGFSTILLWGCEYWIWRGAAGDGRWLEAVKRVLRSA
jgi:hypothetical protein